VSKGFVSGGREYIDDFPFSFGCDVPDEYANLTEEQKLEAQIADSQCFIPPNRYFLRCVLEIPIREHHEAFLWGLWVTVHEKDFKEFDDYWSTAGKALFVGPYKGRIANKIKEIYSPSTMNLKCRIIVQPVGQRPLIIIEEPEHPLAVQQKFGIDKALAMELARKVMKANR
jgi:hypothetical protein